MNPLLMQKLGTYICKPTCKKGRGRGLKGGRVRLANYNINITLTHKHTHEHTRTHMHRGDIKVKQNGENFHLTF